MPAKIDSCVEKVKKQFLAKGMSEKEASKAAYGICSKSTGWKKTGAHTWKKEPKDKDNDKDKDIEIKESVMFKLESLLESIEFILSAK